MKISGLQWKWPSFMRVSFAVSCTGRLQSCNLPVEHIYCFALVDFCSERWQGNSRNMVVVNCTQSNEHSPWKVHSYILTFAHAFQHAIALSLPPLQRWESATIPTPTCFFLMLVPTTSLGDLGENMMSTWPGHISDWLPSDGTIAPCWCEWFPGLSRFHCKTVKVSSEFLLDPLKRVATSVSTCRVQHGPAKLQDAWCFTADISKSWRV